MYALLKRLFVCTLIAGLLGASTVIAGSMVGLNPDSSNSVKLSELLDGTHAGVTVGDKVFDEFVYDVLSGDMPDAEDVNVLGFTDTDGNIGITFHGAFLDLPFDDTSSNALLRFTTSLDPAAEQAGKLITDAHLFMAGISVGANSVFSVGESFEGYNNSMTVYSSKIDGQEEQVTSAWTSFVPAVNRLRITKGIFAFASEGALIPPVVSAIDQSFSQVPEPTTLALLALSMVGTLLVARRRQG